LFAGADGQGQWPVPVDWNRLETSGLRLEVGQNRGAVRQQKGTVKNV
jgi:hypothetical protein